MATLDEKILEINKTFDAKVAAVNEERETAITQAKVDDMLERLPSMSVGNIISIFENISPEVLKTRGGEKTINGFLRLFKEDKNIHNAYLMKENLINNIGIENPVQFINSLLAIARETKDPKTLKESKKNLVGYVTEAVRKVAPGKIVEKIQLDETIERLNDSIEVLTWDRKKLQNAAAMTRSLNETVEFLSRKLDNKTKETEFEDCKNLCLKTIDEAWEQSDSNVRIKLTEVKDKLSKKMYSEVTADEDIKYMRQLIDTIK